MTLRPRLYASLVGAVMMTVAGAPVVAAPTVGAPAPDFTVVGSDGNTYSLGDFQGQAVVLEWTNHKCPFVVKHYDTGNMQATQAHAGENGAVWLTVISSAPGTQGHLSPEQANELSAKRNADPKTVLLDESGTMGRAYDARTTPHMYLIDEDGILRYMGAIDDRPTARHGDVEGARNHVVSALDEWSMGAEVSVPVTTAYGCSIKYKD